MNYLLPLCAVFIWAINAIVSKMTVGVIAPAAIAFYRWFLAWLILTPFVLPGVLVNRALLRRHWWQLAILGLLGMVLYQTLTYYAAHTVSATLLGIFNALIPLLTLLISLWLLRTTPTVGMLVGALCSFAGLVWLLSAGNLSTLWQGGLNSGEGLMLLAVMAYALYSVLVKYWHLPFTHWQALYCQIAFGVLFLLPNFLHTAQVAITQHNISLILFSGVFASLVAPLLWLLAISRLGASTSAIFMNLMPIFTTIIAIFYLQEQIHLYHLIGGGMTIIGVLLSQSITRPLTINPTSRLSMLQKSQR